MTTHVLELPRKCDGGRHPHEGRLIAVGTVDELRRDLNMPEGSLEDLFLSSGECRRPIACSMRNERPVSVSVPARDFSMPFAIFAR